MIDIRGPFRRKKEFRCAQCGEVIEFNSKEAVTFEDGYFCNYECASKHAHIEPVLWGDVKKYETIECLANGYGVSHTGPNWFSNGKYVIFDALPADADACDCFVRHNADALSGIRGIFSNETFEQLTMDDVKFYKAYSGEYAKCLGVYVNRKYFEFVAKYCDLHVAFRAFAKDYSLYLKINGINSAIFGLFGDKSMLEEI